MRSGIGNSPTDPLYTAQSAASVDSSGNPITQPGTAASSPYFTKPVGGATLATNQIAVTTSATLVVAARAGRQSVTISSTSAVVFYLGATGVTISNGLYVAAAAGASITLNTAAAVYAVGASAVTLSYLENY